MLKALSRVMGSGLELRGMPSIAQLDQFMDWLANGGGETWSGANVTTTTAMRHEAVSACVTLRANSLAQLPLLVYQQNDDGGQIRARNHYLYNLLRWQVNPYTTAFAWKRFSEMMICIYGNSYTWMNIAANGVTTELWPWHPSRVEVKWEEFAGAKIPFYYYRREPGEQPFRAPYWEMIHLRGPSTDGFFGLAPIQEHRQTIGYAMAVKEHGSRVFANGAAIRGVFSPKQGAPAPTPAQLDMLKERWKESNTGAPNAGKALFAPVGLDFQPITMTLQDAQYVDSENLTVPQICRIFGVPPHKVFELGRATWGNTEQMDIDWRVDRQGPEIVNWEDELNASLLSTYERQTYRIEFLVNALMRADSAARANYFKAALAGAPWITQREARNIESMNPEPDGEYAPTNNAPQREQTTPA